MRAPVPWPLGALCEPMYRAAVAWRNRAFDAGRGVTKLACPVVSVGNLSVGGTGKTPMVAAILRWLLHAERRPCIAMRGYARRAGAMSDEEAEHRAAFPNIPIVAQPDRLAAIVPLLQRGEADCVVLDDGFQHRRIARDLDIVLIDATRGPFEDRCLPAGWLREPVGSLRRAHAVVITHCESVDDAARERLARQVERVAGRPPVAAARHAWDGLRIGERHEDLAWLRGRRVVAACGIGNAGPFLDALRATGASVLHEDVRPDHHDWSATDAARLAERARLLDAHAAACTEKDWVKLERHAESLGNVPVARPVLSMRFDRGADVLRDMVLVATAVRSPDHRAPVGRGAEDA